MNAKYLDRMSCISLGNFYSFLLGRSCLILSSWSACNHALWLWMGVRQHQSCLTREPRGRRICHRVWSQLDPPENWCFTLTSSVAAPTDSLCEDPGSGRFLSESSRWRGVLAGAHVAWHVAGWLAGLKMDPAAFKRHDSAYASFCEAKEYLFFLGYQGNPRAGRKNIPLTVCTAEGQVWERKPDSERKSRPACMYTMI